MTDFRKLGAAVLLACLPACGGGGGSGNSNASSLSAGGSTGAAAPSNNTVQPSAVANTQAVTVGQGLSGVYNLLTTSVTICVPGTSQCQTIDNVQVDTGSVGLRILSSALASNLALPAVGTSGGGVSAACGVFGSGYTWGAVRLADVKLAGETAASLPVQVIADPSTPTTPSDCSGAGTAMQTQGALHLNGILGIGMYKQDCGSGCVGSALTRWYYSCTSDGSCTNSTQPLAQQIANPVGAFGSDNNGVMVSLPSIPSTGQTSVKGTLTFGIGTQPNNALGSATILPTTNGSVYITSQLNGATNNDTFIDSGSNGFFFADTSLTQCGSWYCQNAQLPVTLQGGSNSASITVPVVSMQTLQSSGNYAFSDAAGPTSGVVDLGLPFFFGRNVFVAIEGQATPGGTGPYYAF